MGNTASIAVCRFVFNCLRALAIYGLSIKGSLTSLSNWSYIMILGYILFSIGAACLLVQVGCAMYAYLQDESPMDVLGGFAVLGCAPSIAGLQIGAAIIESAGG